MDNTRSNTVSSLKQADTGRRSFMWKFGAGMSAVLAAAVPAFSKPVKSNDEKLKDNVDRLSRRIATLENEKSIRKLHRRFEDLIDKGMYSEVIDLFSDDAEVIYNGGVFSGKSGIKRLFCVLFSSGMTGKRIDSAPGFQLNSDQQQDALEISPDMKSAKAGFTYSIQAGIPIDSDSTLVKMARIQGEGIMKWWEGGVYELSYLKNSKDGCWKIKGLEYRDLSRADYKPGKACAKPISVPKFSNVYPDDPSGPDRLV